MEKLSRNPVLVSITGILLAVLLLWCGYAYGKSGSKFPIYGVSDCHRTYNLLDPSIDCAKIEDVKDSVRTLEVSVNTYIDQLRESKKVNRVSVFYRDLITRRWFGVGADEEYYPASLAKLPLAITYYKVADLEPMIFDQNLKLEKSDLYNNDGQKVGVDSPMEVGQTYAVRRMVEDMLVYSDNRPIGPLISFMRPDVWKKVYADLGVRKQASDGTDDWSVTARTLALIFRSLFNGSYLDLASSQEILETLSKARYAEGLVAGVPTTVRVAHKFGEATMLDDSQEKTPVLHDCGIIYKPEKPYILCVMTEGKDFKSLEETIASISRMVYEAQ